MGKGRPERASLARTPWLAMRCLAPAPAPASAAARYSTFELLTSSSAFALLPRIHGPFVMPHDAAPEVSSWFAFLSVMRLFLVGHEMACIARPDVRQTQQGQEVRRVEVRIPCGSTADLRAYAQIALQ